MPVFEVYGASQRRFFVQLRLGVIPQSPNSCGIITCTNGVRGVKSMSLTLIAVANRGDLIELTYEEAVGDPQPFVLTLTSRHISIQTFKPLPISASDLVAYVLTHETELQRPAENCKAKGLTAVVLQ
jgi:hypothetical protein